MSDREIEVFKKLYAQKTAKEIGENLYISHRTVAGHRKNLMQKTGAKNIAEFIIYATESGIFSVKVKEFAKI